MLTKKKEKRQKKKNLSLSLSFSVSFIHSAKEEESSNRRKRNEGERERTRKAEGSKRQSVSWIFHRKKLSLSYFTPSAARPASPAGPRRGRPTLLPVRQAAAEEE